MNNNNPALALETATGTFVVQDHKGVRALLKAFAWHLLDGAWNPVPSFDGPLDPSDVRKYIAEVTTLAENARGSDQVPCIWVKVPYPRQVEVKWESQGTPGRWVSLSRSPAGEWSLNWDSATGQQSQFIQQSWMEPLLWACPWLDWDHKRELHPTERYV